jgi:hypothetical protein
MAFYCSTDCQRTAWKTHRQVCKGLRKGQDLLGSRDALPPNPPEDVFGFEEQFTSVDSSLESDSDYNPNEEPVWEYDAGKRGQPDWRRYPAHREESLENLLNLGSPRFMYLPGNVEVDGVYEQTLSPRPPSHVATRYVYYCENMVERDIYTGAARAVRRN